jgi:hypothetical protein
MWKLHWETNPSSFLSLLCIAPPKKSRAKIEEWMNVGEWWEGTEEISFLFLLEWVALQSQEWTDGDRKTPEWWSWSPWCSGSFLDSPAWIAPWQPTLRLRWTTPFRNSPPLHKTQQPSPPQPNALPSLKNTSRHLSSSSRCVCLSLARYKAFVSKTFCAFFSSNSFSQNRNRASCSCSSPASSPQTVVTIQMRIDLKAPKAANGFWGFECTKWNVIRQRPFVTSIEEDDTRRARLRRRERRRKTKERSACATRASCRTRHPPRAPPKIPASHTTFVLIQSQTPCCFSLFIHYYFF